MVCSAPVCLHATVLGHLRVRANLPRLLVLRVVFPDRAVVRDGGHVMGWVGLRLFVFCIVVTLGKGCVGRVPLRWVGK